MEMQHIVYEAVGPTGLYVGKTSQPLSKRWQNHLYDARRGSKHRFHNAIRAHGVEAFKLEVVLAGFSEADALACECLIIKQHKEAGETLYNITDGGEGVSGLKMSPEAVEKMRQRKLGVKQSAETIEKRRAALMGRAVSAETREKIASAQRGRVFSEEHLARMRKPKSVPVWNKGKPASEEAKARMSASGLGRKRKPFTAETIAKMRIAASIREQKKRAANGTH